MFPESFSSYLVRQMQMPMPTPHASKIRIAQIDITTIHSLVKPQRLSLSGAVDGIENEHRREKGKSFVVRRTFAERAERLVRSVFAVIYAIAEQIRMDAELFSRASEVLARVL
jgi:hypothetical protein